MTVISCAATGVDGSAAAFIIMGRSSISGWTVDRLPFRQLSRRPSETPAAWAIDVGFGSRLRDRLRQRLRLRLSSGPPGQTTRR